MARTGGIGEDRGADGSTLARIRDEIARSSARVEARIRSIPAIRYPDDLPVAARKDEIIAAIRDHQVVVVCGATGSGKTTQIAENATGDGAGDARIHWAHAAAADRGAGGGGEDRAGTRRDARAEWWGTRCALRTRQASVRW